MIFAEAFYDRFSDGVIVSDGRGDSLYINPAAKRLFHADIPPQGKLNACKALCGRLFADGIHSCAEGCPLRRPDAQASHVSFKGKRGPQARFEWKDLSIQKIEHWEHLRVHCLKIPGQTFGFGEEARHFTLIEDVSAEDELSRRKEDWRSMVAHDLRSPLSGITTTLKLIQEVPPGRPLNAREVQLLAIALRSGRKIADLLDLFLDVAQLDSGKMPVRLRLLELAPLLGQVVEDHSARTIAKKLSVRVEVRKEDSVFVDADLFTRVLDNILGNAVKFTPEDGMIMISGGGAPGEALTLSIRDTGPGIAAEEIPLIFDRYHQAQARRQGLIQGNGLGLTFCREALKAMGGAIAVRSAPGMGAEFIVNVPRAERRL